MANHTVDVGLRVDGGDASASALDRMTAALFGDLRAARVGAVSRPTGTGEQGAKSGLVPLAGELTVSGVVSASVWLLYRTVVAFVERSKARSVTVKVGETEVEVTGASKDEVAAALELAVRHVTTEKSGDE